MKLKLCMNGEVLWNSVSGDDLPGGVDYAEVAGWWREAATAVLDVAYIEYDLANPGLRAWNGENKHTGQCGGLMWWGKPTTDEHEAIERASDAGHRAVCEEALRCYADDIEHWASAVSELPTEGADGADAEFAYARESLEWARSTHTLLGEELRGVTAVSADGSALG